MEENNEFVYIIPDTFTDDVWGEIKQKTADLQHHMKSVSYCVLCEIIRVMNDHTLDDTAVTERIVRLFEQYNLPYGKYRDR